MQNEFYFCSSRGAWFLYWGDGGPGERGVCRLAILSRLAEGEAIFLFPRPSHMTGVDFVCRLINKLGINREGRSHCAEQQSAEEQGAEVSSCMLIMLANLSSALLLQSLYRLFWLSVNFLKAF